MKMLERIVLGLTLVLGLNVVSASSAHAQTTINARAFLAGGDVSVLTLMEAKGAVYKDRHGKPGDALAILQGAGHNIVRLRLYEQPGPGNGNYGKHWPKGSQDLADILRLARRSAALGMQIQLSLHYSDFWTNGETQIIPVTWERKLGAISNASERLAMLKKLVYQHTHFAMSAMKHQGTVPQSVSLGNEIAGGILFPYAELYPKNAPQSATAWKNLAELLQAGHDAVKAVSPSTKVVIHLDDGGNTLKFTHFFDQLRAHGARWDVIGASYYPFWTKKTVGELVPFIKALSDRYGSEVLIMEAGFNWAPNLTDGAPGQLEHNGPYPGSMSSPGGQKAFMDELVHTLKQMPQVLGLLYWDPIMIERPGIGWAYDDDNGRAERNVVANTTLFDFDGKALPVLDGWHLYTK